MSLAVDLQNRPEDPSLLAQLPSWAKRAEQKIVQGELAVKFRVEKAPSPAELDDLAQRLSTIAGRTVLLEWYFESLPASIDNRIISKSKRTDFFTVWIPQKNTVKIFIDASKAEQEKIAVGLKKKFNISAIFAATENGTEAEKLRIFKRLHALLPSGFDWKFEFREHEVLATHRGKRIPAGYQQLLKRALTGYIDWPVVFEPRFDPSRFKKIAVDGCPEGVKIIRNTLYQTRPGEAVGFLRMRAEVSDEKREVFEKWIRTIEDEFSLFADVSFQDTRQIVKAQLADLARKNGGLIDKPDLVAGLIRSFHGERPPNLEQSRNPLRLRAEDLRNLPIITIDGEGTLDPEDGVSVQWHVPGEIARVTIAIADASQIAFPGSESWEYAQRATQSLYARLPHRTISVPILGELISNNHAALIPDKDREAWAIEVDLDLRAGSLGKIMSYRVFPALIRSKAMLSFDQAEQILEGQSHPQAEQLNLLKIVAQALRDARFKSHRFPKFPSQYHGEVLIEELMILAYSTLGTFTRQNKIPAIYRVYSPPDPAQLGRYVKQVKALGIKEVELEDFRDPLRLNALFSCLVEFGPIARRLYLEMLHAFFGLADYSPHGRPHKALGVESYGRGKSRHLDGLYNQNVLRRYFAGVKPLEDELRTRIVARCRRRQHTREYEEGRLYGLGLAEFQARKVGRVYLATAVQSSPSGMVLEVQGFGPALLKGASADRPVGAILKARYLGYEPLAGLYIFERA